ncbi:LegC family aminotransferase [Caloranaerobacter ferrireducens]|uniref:LegC family aminotransferase n=1 Tax=Caloranaerobacter ferrireducens TaxID=1323370 RepID=UPI00084DE899|nr:LegC family aminotransferase [Caloranaerobacter ferrireducens]
MIPLCIPEIRGNEWKYIKECLDTNWVSSAGKYVDLFEERFKEYIGSKKAIVTVNGTSALHLALSILGIGPGDEVIVPSMTFVASINPIIYVGAEPVFVDICRDTYVMDVNKVEELITEKTKAIMPVHIYGHPVDMEPLMKLAKKYNLYVIEDATEALGSEYMTSDGIWHKVGTIGDIGCFSFNGNKLITTGAGGMLVTNDEELGEKAKFLSTQAKVIGENKSFSHPEIGYNFRMPNLLAAMGVAQLEKIEEYIKIKRDNAKYYNQLLKEVEGITIPIEKDWAKNCYWLYSIVIEDEYGIKRDELIKIMAENKIETRPFFNPIHNMIPYKKYKCGKLTVTNELSRKGINLPSSVSLTFEDIDKIAKIIRRA